MKPRNHRGIFRPRNVAITDTRSPMLRLLQDCNNASSGMIEVEYAQQWPTLNKAVRLGLVDDHQRLTDKGREFIAKESGIATIKKGDRVFFKPEWQDKGDAGIEFRAIEDEDGGRVSVVALIGFAINPVQVVEVSMIAGRSRVAQQVDYPEAAERIPPLKSSTRY